MSHPFGGFLPSEPEPEIADAEFEEVAPQPVPEAVPPVPPMAVDTPVEVDTAKPAADTTVEVEAVPDAEVPDTEVHDADVEEYRRKFGLISPETMAHIVGIHVDTLKLWRRDGRGPNYLRVGKRIWYYHDLVQEWLPSTRVRYEEATEKVTTGVATPVNKRTDKDERAEAGVSEEPGPQSDKPGPTDAPD